MLDKCPECGRENIPETAEACPDCGHKFENKKKKTKIIISIVVVAAVILAVFLCVLFIKKSQGLEKEAKGYFQELEKIVGDVELIDAVCITQIYYGDENVTYCYLFFYEKDGREDFAFFNSLGYVGNGYNGGYSSDDFQASINDVQSLTAQKEYLEYLLDGSHLITEQQAKDNKKGLIPLDIEKID